MNILEVQSLYKSFGNTSVLKDFNISIRENEVYGLLGKNGAGKSTFINILGTILKPDAGTFLFENIPYDSDLKAYKKKIAVVPQELALFPKLSVIDNILYWGGINGLKRSEAKKRGLALLENYGISERRNDHIDQLSGGMKRYVSIVAALILKPKLLILDEPTVGIDPVQREKLLKLISKLKHQGCSVIFCTHYLKEVEETCDRIGLLVNGNIKAEGTLEEIRAKYGENAEEIAITLTEHVNGLQFPLENIKAEEKLITHFCTDSGKALVPLLQFLEEKNKSVEHIDVKKFSLESIFMKLSEEANN